MSAHICFISERIGYRGCSPLGVIAQVCRVADIIGYRYWLPNLRRLRIAAVSRVECGCDLRCRVVARPRDCQHVAETVVGVSRCHGSAAGRRGRGATLHQSTRLVISEDRRRLAALLHAHQATEREDSNNRHK